VDQSGPLLETARRRLEEAGLAGRARFERADLADYTPPPDADLIVAGAVVQYLEDEPARAVFRRIAAALAPDGVAYVRTTIAPDSEAVWISDASYHAIYRPDGWYRAAFAAAGLRVEAFATSSRFVPEEAARRVWFPYPGILRWVWRRLTARRRCPRRVHQYATAAIAIARSHGTHSRRADAARTGAVIEP
jgi:hypothetical protein